MTMPGMGSDLPAPSWSAMTAWAPETFFVVGVAAAGLLYTAGSVRLWRRGDRWPAGRYVSFVAGLATILAVTCTGVGSYAMELFSVHMVQHMVLSMLAPIFLLLGAPATLALRALRPARAGAVGLREVLLSVLHSRLATVLASPLVRLPLFIGSLYGLYFTPLFDALMRSRTGHAVMLVHFLAVGLLFFWPILAVDPVPRRFGGNGHLMRVLELFAGMPFHAFFGVAVMMSSGVLLKTFAHPPPAWGISPLSDQAAAGGITWASGEVPTLVVLLAIFVQWARSDARAARRTDRAAERDGDAELAAYNARLATLARLTEEH